jgi:hypothetical protein
MAIPTTSINLGVNPHLASRLEEGAASKADTATVEEQRMADEKIVSEDAHIPLKPWELDLQLREAIRLGDHEKIRRCVAAGADLNYDNTMLTFEGQSTLSGDHPLKNSVHQVNFRGSCTPLKYAIFLDKPDVVELLSLSGAALDGGMDEPMPPVSLALTRSIISDIDDGKDSKETESILGILLRRGAEPNISTDRNNDGIYLTPLEEAVGGRSKKTVNLLLRYGARISFGVLQKVAETNQIAILRSLIDHEKSCVNFFNTTHRTLLHELLVNTTLPDADRFEMADHLVSQESNLHLPEREPDITVEGEDGKSAYDITETMRGELAVRIRRLGQVSLKQWIKTVSEVKKWVEQDQKFIDKLELMTKLSKCNAEEKMQLLTALSSLIPGLMYDSCVVNCMLLCCCSEGSPTPGHFQKNIFIARIIIKLSNGINIHSIYGKYKMTALHQVLVLEDPANVPVSVAYVNDLLDENTEYDANRLDGAFCSVAMYAFKRYPEIFARILRERHSDGTPKVNLGCQTTFASAPDVGAGNFTPNDRELITLLDWAVAMVERDRKERSENVDYTKPLISAQYLFSYLEEEIDATVFLILNTLSKGHLPKALLLDQMEFLISERLGVMGGSIAVTDKGKASFAGMVAETMRFLERNRLIPTTIIAKLTSANASVEPKCSPEESVAGDRKGGREEGEIKRSKEDKTKDEVRIERLQRRIGSLANYGIFLPLKENTESKADAAAAAAAAGGVSAPMHFSYKPTSNEIGNGAAAELPNKPKANGATSIGAASI